MAKSYQQMSKSELLAELGRLQAAAVVAREAIGDLEIHREELRAQQDLLIQTQELLKDSRDRYADLFDFAPVAHVVLNDNGVIQDINLTASAMLDDVRARLVDFPFFMFVLPVERRTFLALLSQCRRSATSFVLDLTLSTRGQRRVPVHMTAKRSSGDRGGEPLLHLAFVDLTEQRRAEEERQRIVQREQLARAASDAKDQFIAMMSHELRTPLTPILFAVGALERQPDLPEPIKRPLEMMKRNVELEARLIDDLLDVTRIAHGKLRLAREVVDVHPLLEDVCGRYAEDMQATGIAVAIELSAEQHHVDGDPVRLRQVFWNLFRNAMQHTSRGGRITVRTRSAHDGTLDVTVADTGTGIDPNALPNIFAPFEQSGDRRVLGAGLGLGLAICRGVVQAHGGRVAAYSAGLGHGATFVVSLHTTAKPQTAQPTAEEGPVDGTGQTILLVEDNADNAEAIAEILRMHGYTVRVASTVAEGLALAEQGFDVLVSDIGLPDGTGRDLMRQLCARQPVKGIALTGYGMDRDIVSNENAGFARHLTKPVDVNDLLAAINELAGGPQPTQ